MQAAADLRTPGRTVDSTQLVKAFEALALLAAGAVFVVWQLRSTERDLQRSRAQRQARETLEASEARDGKQSAPPAGNDVKDAKAPNPEPRP
ncbi:MAG: hypothetical protein RLZ83_1412 [Pseudomonadota bacterium]|jgi:hypothetical protein